MDKRVQLRNLIQQTRPNTKELVIYQIPDTAEARDDRVDAMFGKAVPIGHYQPVFEGKVPDEMTLEDVFFHFQRYDGRTTYLDQHDELQLRSLSVGDVVVLDGKGFRCASVGWVEFM